MQYSIQGDNLPVVICTLGQGEQMLTEKGAMSWMTSNISMETSMNGGLGRAFGRAFSGESMFMNIFTCTSGEGMIAFASSFPGRILPLAVTPSSSIVVQKTAFLAAEMGVELHTHFTKKLGVGFFGGEGFIMQRLSGSGMAFAEIDGELIEYQLGAGETLIVDTGNVAGFEVGVSMEIKQVAGLKNKLLGGEGFFNTVLTGPGKVWLQTMPISNVARAISRFIPAKTQ